MRMHAPPVVLISALVFLVSAHVDDARAGDCMEGQQYFLSALQTSRLNEGEEVEHDLGCSAPKLGYYIQGYQYFASPTAIESLERANRDTGKLANAVLPRFLSSKEPRIRCLAASAMAYYRIPEAYSHIQECEDIPLKATLYGILGDERAVPWIVEQFRLMDAKFRQHPAACIQDKIVLLNALYHIASADSVSFLDEVIGNPRFPEIRERALRAKERVLSRAAKKSEG